MPRVILQPIGRRDAKEHYQQTIVTGVDVDFIKKYQPSVSKELDLFYPQGKVFIWGVVPGVNGQNISKWEKMNKGDITLFCDKGIIAKSATTIKFHNHDLAVALWGYDPNGYTWEYIYLVQEATKFNLSYELFNATLKYSPKFVVQGLMILDQVKSDKLFAKFNLLSNIICEETSEEDYTQAVETLSKEESLDNKIFANTRKEQSFLRNYLFKGQPIGRCGICGKEFPVDLLVTAHIKKRSECSNEEKLDYKNVVMPMCKCGCDSAYENGYIYVDEHGIVRQNHDKNVTSDMNEMLQKLDGNTCAQHNLSSAPYFEYHRHKLGK